MGDGEESESDELKWKLVEAKQKPPTVRPRHVRHDLLLKKLKGHNTQQSHAGKNVRNELMLIYSKSLGRAIDNVLRMKFS